MRANGLLSGHLEGSAKTRPSPVLYGLRMVTLIARTHKGLTFPEEFTKDVLDQKSLLAASVEGL